MRETCQCPLTEGERLGLEDVEIFRLVCEGLTGRQVTRPTSVVVFERTGGTAGRDPSKHERPVGQVDRLRLTGPGPVEPLGRYYDYVYMSIR